MTRDEFENLLEVNGIAFVGEAAWRVAQLVAANEREACAKACENLKTTSSRRCAEAIRARGQQ